jgi:DNA-binding PucR family transcriptional regulator
MRQEIEIGRDRLEALLADGVVDASGFLYDLDAHHLAVIVSGSDRQGLLRRLAEQLDRDLLSSASGEGDIFAWWGGRHEFDQDDLSAISGAALGRDGRVVVGEPGFGPAGWLLSHRQARRAYTFSRARPELFVSYREVALLAAVATDEELSGLLRHSFIEPIFDPGSAGAELASTLRACLDVDGDLSSTAAALGVPRQSVADRMREVEERIGRSPSNCLAELDLALRLLESSEGTVSGDRGRRLHSIASR